MKKISKKGSQQIKEDEETYKKVWNSRPHTCEECGIWLGDDFQDEYGHIAKFMFSHILTKAAYPEFRNNPKNFNLLCLRHHQEWEFSSSRHSMNIFEKNEKTIGLLKSGVWNTEISRALWTIKEKSKNNYSIQRALDVFTELEGLEALDEDNILEGLTKLINIIASEVCVDSDYKTAYKTFKESLEELITKYSNRNIY